MSQQKALMEQARHQTAPPEEGKQSEAENVKVAASKGARTSLDEDSLERAFLADDLIPDAASAFGYQIPPVEEAIKTADIVLDTNVLLLPYGAGSGSLGEIIKVLRPLAEEKRLYLPGQVAREFIRNRPNKLGELQQQLQDKISRFLAIDRLNFPILEGDAEYSKLYETMAKTSALKKELGDASAAVVQKIKSWEWNDPVNTAYRTVFSPATIISPAIDRVKTLAELRRRQRMQIPPGYKDAAKDDSGIGDFLIWLTILEIGSKNKKPLIFVSGEEKSDWQHRSGGAGFLPRYELVDEYRRSSEGKPFYLIPLSRLLELLHAKSESVIQIKHEEVRVQEASSIDVECPVCASEVPARLGDYIGATAHPRCSACSTQFHIHRTRNGLVIRGPDETRPRTEVTQEEHVSCPNCGADIATNLGLQRNATRWCRCSSCEAIFPIHRRTDGGVMISRVSRSPTSGED